MNKTLARTAFIVGTAALGAFLIVTSIASAATMGVGIGVSAQANVGGRGGMHGGMMPGVFGTVSAINGTTITITSKGFAGYGHPSSTTAMPTPTTYTVDASNATVVKDGASSTISSVAVGDTIVVRGTVSGTNVTATSIFDGVVPGGANPGGPMRGFGHGNGSSTGMWSASSTALFQGNGEPVIGGTVTAITGSTLTVTNKSNVTYTVDGSSAVVVKGNVSSSLANVAVNDNVLIQGAVNGTSVTASTILDQSTTTGSGSGSGSHGGPGGFVGHVFGGIGAFFQHIFGFF